MDLKSSMFVSAAGMKAQGERIKMISQNIANSDSTAQTPGGEPFRRKVLTFKNYLDRNVDARVVKVDKIGSDKSDFELRYDPGHPAANADGYVLMPNVNTMIEMADMREAQRSYEANLSVIDISRTLMMRTIQILRG
ncbi:MAG: flagellar basal body rod protein FlgC [Elsteraceae bacterium]